MEEVRGAEHCSVASCMQLDFLPFQCDACGKAYCQNHFAYANHDCPVAQRSSVQVLICPMCSQSVRISPNEDPNVTWDRHYVGSCSRVLPTKKASKKCPVKGCKETLGPSNRVECGSCGQMVCLKHRLPEDHECPGPSKAKTSSKAGRGSQQAPAQAKPRPAPKANPDQVSMDERLARQLQEEELRAAGAHHSRPQAAPAHASAEAAPRPQANQRPAKKKWTDRMASAVSKGLAMVRGKTRDNQRLLG